jgi:hypothetical protein
LDRYAASFARRLLRPMPIYLPLTTAVAFHERPSSVAIEFVKLPFVMARSAIKVRARMGYGGKDPVTSQVHGQVRPL